MTDEAKALVDHIRENYDLCECEHGFRLYEGHTCPNDFCDRRDMRRLTDLIETQAREIERLREALTMCVAEMMRASGRLEIIATCNEDRRIVAALSGTCDYVRSALGGSNE